MNLEIFKPNVKNVTKIANRVNTPVQMIVPTVHMVNISTSEHALIVNKNVILVRTEILAISV